MIVIMFKRFWCKAKNAFISTVRVCFHGNGKKDAYKAMVEFNNTKILNLEAGIDERKGKINPRYRPLYHVSPPFGWLNDPNGFIYYKGNYHLFYQFNPYDTHWGPMHWGHVTSPDLVRWKRLPTALIPGEEQCFSGSAVVDGDILVLIYTGRVVLHQKPYFVESQYLAFSDDGINFVKYPQNPVLTMKMKGAPDFRDPKIWKYGAYWYVVIGSKTEDSRGRALLYTSTDLINWKFVTVLAESKGELGYMWECPDFFELNGKHVLLMSPQGITPHGDRFKNRFQSGYIIGNFNYDTFEFKPETEFQEIDFGHDYYAPQTTEKDGKRYLVAWFGMWEEDHREEHDGWANMLTIVRELKLSKDNRILSNPVEEMESIREETVVDGDIIPEQSIDFKNAAEIIVTGDTEDKIDISIEGREGGQKVQLQWDPEIRKVVLNRDGNVREVKWIPIESRSWRIFLDASSIELFCGEGEVVFSSRVYPTGGWRITNLSDQVLNISGYNLKKSVSDDLMSTI